MKLELNKLSKKYDENTVVKEVSLTVEEGQFLALLGPSGCGKTTILRMIAGFEEVTSGSIQLGNQTFNDAQLHLAPEERKLGMVFQSYALWPHLNVYDNVAYPLKIKGIKGKEQQKQVNEMLAQTGLTDYAKRHPKDLSGGQQQRVALSRSLVTRPKVILLDEPLANLDRHLRDSMQETFKRLNKDSGITFIYVTHDQHEAMNLADKIAVLNDGKLMQYDTPESLYQSPQTPWLGSFIGEGSVLSVKSHSQGVLLSGQAAMESVCTDETNTQALVRPQHVSLSDEGLSATVTHCQFTGERYKISLALPKGGTLLSYHHSAVAHYSQVRATITQVWVFPE